MARHQLINPLLLLALFHLSSTANKHVTVAPRIYKCYCGGFIVSSRPAGEVHGVYHRAFSVHFDCSDRNRIRCRNICEQAAGANTNEKGLSQVLPSVNQSVGDYACRQLAKDIPYSQLVVRSKLCSNDWMDTRFQLLHPICCKDGKYNCS